MLMMSLRLAGAVGMMFGGWVQLNSSISSVTERIRLQGIRRNLKSGKEHIDMDALMDLTELHQVLQDYAKDIRERYKDVLANNGHIASHDLVNSIKTEVVVGEQSYEVTMTLADYWKYVEYDTRGRQTGLPSRKDPPFAAIHDWVKVKKLVPKNTKNLPREKALAALAGAIKHKIGEFGTKGGHELETARTKTLDDWMDRLREAIGQDAIVYVTKLLRDVAV